METPTDVLIRAVDDAEKFAGVIVLSVDKDGIGRVYNGLGGIDNLVCWLETFKLKIVLGLISIQEDGEDKL